MCVCMCVAPAAMLPSPTQRRPDEASHLWTLLILLALGGGPLSRRRPPPPFPPPSWLYAEQDAGMTDCNFTSAPFCRVTYVPAKTPLKPPTHSARLLCGSFVTEYRQKSDMNRDAQVSQKPGSPSFQPLPRSFPALIHGNSYLVSASVHVVTRPTRPDVGNFVLHNPLSL